MNRFVMYMVLLMIVAPVSLVGATTYHTITVDGNTSDFSADELVWTDSSSDCAWDYNELYKLYVTWDAQKLYIGADFLIEQANALSMYMDFGWGDGAHDLSTVSWFKFFYTQDWLANFSVNVSGNGTHGIFRIYADLTHSDWSQFSDITKVINLDAGMYEIGIPWSRLYPQGMPAHAYMKLVATLTGFRGYDGADAMPDQTVNPNGDGEFDTLDIVFTANFDSDGNGVPDEGWPSTQTQTPIVSASANPTSGVAPLTVNFSCLASDPDGGNIVGYSWNFGDGGSSTEQNPTHTYNSAGSFTATVTATDDEGETGNDSVTITVTTSGGITIDLKLSKESPDCFYPGNQFVLTCDITNTGAKSNVDFYCALDVLGMYYFYDGWTQDVDSKFIAVEPGNTTVDIFNFPWPAGAGTLSGVAFYAVLTEPGNFNLASNVEMVTFCFAE